ncbi:MAG: DUF2927 domain-containing protein [Pseudomonadota bacterium]
MTRFFGFAAICAVLAGCAAQPPSLFHEAGRGAPQIIAPRPDYPGYGAAVGKQDVPWRAKDLVADFMDLNFKSESGRRIRKLPRWEGPVRVALASEELRAYRADVEALVETIRANAPGLDLAVTDAPRGDITLRTAPRDEMQERAPEALCFFNFVGVDWPAYRDREYGEPGVDQDGRISAVTIFIPANAAPHVYRTCIFEEIMQALGPTNDLYRLEDSGFNDDEAHNAPTAFDLLMLRLLYAPELERGMDRAAARKGVAAVLRRIGHDGDRDRPGPVGEARYVHLYAKGLSDEHSVDERRRSLLEAIDFTGIDTDHDFRRGEALRALMITETNASELDAAIRHGRAAEAFFEAYPDPGSARLARVRRVLGFRYLEADEIDEAFEAFEAAEGDLAAHMLDDELALALYGKAVALARLARFVEAEEAADAALDWAAYVFGADSATLATWRRVLRSYEIGV